MAEQSAGPDNPGKMEKAWNVSGLSTKVGLKVTEMLPKAHDGEFKAMYIIGENIHILSDNVKAAIADRDAGFFQKLAVEQVEAGAQALDLNLGPRKKDGEELFPWMVKTVEAVVDVPLSFDSTNLLGIEAGLKTVTKARPIINSTSAEPERLEAAFERFIAEYGAPAGAMKKPG